jgi:uridine kinase
MARKRESGVRCGEGIDMTPRETALLLRLAACEVQKEARSVFVLRRILRDTQERGRDVVSVCTQYLATVRPMHQAFVAPSREHAHIIIPSGDDTQPAITLLSAEVQRHIDKAATPSVR